MSFGVIAASVAVASSIAGTYMSIQGQKAAVKAQEQAAKYNADQARKQAKKEEDTAVENMRRKRLDNRRKIARQRAMGARSGLKESGAVVDMLADTNERLHTEVKDIWDAATTRSTQLRGQANMGIWEAQQAKEASKYSIYSTAAKGLASTASAASGLNDALKTKKATTPSSDLTS